MFESEPEHLFRFRFDGLTEPNLEHLFGFRFEHCSECSEPDRGQSTYDSNCNCKGTHRIAVLNDVVGCLLQVNGKACRNKRAQKCPLIPLVTYESTEPCPSQRRWIAMERCETHVIVIRVLVNEMVVLQVVLCCLWCIIFRNPLIVECKKDKMKSLLTHGTSPIDEDVACLKSQ